MSLPEEEAMNIRDGDVVLVPMKVIRSGNHFDAGIGNQIAVYSAEQDHRPRDEREKGPRELRLVTANVHSVLRRELRVGDWVAWADGDPDEQGKIVFIDRDGIVVKRRHPYEFRNHVFDPDALRRIIQPADLTPAEVEEFVMERRR